MTTPKPQKNSETDAPLSWSEAQKRVKQLQKRKQLRDWADSVLSSAGAMEHDSFKLLPKVKQQQSDSPESDS